jgi:hypothetical protein
MSAPLAPLSATEAVAVLDLVRRAIAEGHLPLAELGADPKLSAAARVAYERGLVDFLGACMVPSEFAPATVRAADLAAARFLVDLPVVARQDG